MMVVVKVYGFRSHSTSNAQGSKLAVIPRATKNSKTKIEWPSKLSVTARLVSNAKSMVVSVRRRTNNKDTGELVSRNERLGMP